MKNINRPKPCKLLVKGPKSWKTGVTFSANLAPEGTVTSATFHPWDSRWARHVPKWAQNVILGFKITIFSVFLLNLCSGNCWKMHSIQCDLQLKDTWKTGGVPDQEIRCFSRLGGIPLSYIYNIYIYLYVFYENGVGVCWGLLDRLKILSWGPLRFSTIGKLILRTFTFSWIFDQNRPLAHFSLSHHWPRPSWGPGQARGQAGAQKVEHLSCQMQKFL